MMTVGGICFMYYDWYRRLALESVCELEDRRDSTVQARKTMNQSPLLRDPKLPH